MPLVLSLYSCLPSFLPHTVVLCYHGRLLVHSCRCRIHRHGPRAELRPRPLRLRVDIADHRGQLVRLGGDVNTIYCTALHSSIDTCPRALFFATCCLSHHTSPHEQAMTDGDPSAGGASSAARLPGRHDHQPHGQQALPAAGYVQCSSRSCDSVDVRGRPWLISASAVLCCSQHHHCRPIVPHPEAASCPAEEGAVVGVLRGHGRTPALQLHGLRAAAGAQGGTLRLRGGVPVEGEAAEGVAVLQ